MAYRLLIMDDDPDFVALVAEVANAAQYTTLEISDSTMFESSIMSWSPTHIIIDLNMPAIDGIEALQILARQRSTAKIVICSGAGGDFMEAANRLGERLGLAMSGVIQKPIPLKELRAFLESIASGDESSLAFGHAFDKKVFDDFCDTKGREWTANGLKNLALMIETTFAEKNLASADPEQLARSAHVLASSAWRLGFSEFSHHCRGLEGVCNKKGDLSLPLKQAQDASHSVLTTSREMIVRLTKRPSN